MTGGAFRLPSLALEGPFDLPVRPLALPGVVDATAAEAVSVVVGASRSEVHICRFIRPSGLVGIQLGGSLPEVLRVGLLLRLDAYADRSWSDRTRLSDRTRELRGLPPAEHDLEIRGRARLVAVHAQAGVTAHALLARDSDAEEALVQRVVLDVPRDRVDPSGLLLLGFGSAEGSDDALVPDPLVGLELRRVRVFAPEAGAVGGLVSTGRREVDRWSSYHPGIGFAVVSPPDPVTPVRVVARVRAGDAGQVESRPQRGLAGRLRPARRPELAVLATDAFGARLEVRPQPAEEPGRWTFDLPPGTGPVRVAFPGLGETFGGDAELDLRASTRAS